MSCERIFESTKKICGNKTQYSLIFDDKEHWFCKRKGCYRYMQNRKEKGLPLETKPLEGKCQKILWKNTRKERTCTDLPMKHGFCFKHGCPKRLRGGEICGREVYYKGFCYNHK